MCVCVCVCVCVCDVGGAMCVLCVCVFFCVCEMHVSVWDVAEGNGTPL